MVVGATAKDVDSQGANDEEDVGQSAASVRGLGWGPP